MFDLALLGRLDLRLPGGAECRQLLKRPKLLALLAYLAAARPYGFHRRDRLVAVFWPELDQQRARNALRQAVHHLRTALGPKALLTRGDEELALDPATVRCDVPVFAGLLGVGKTAEAMELVRGELLPGFHLSDAPDFERWLDEEREHLRRQAAGGAARLAQEEEEQRNLVGAAFWARRAVELAPYDEDCLRRLLRVLDLAGDRAGALKAYEKFACTLEEDLGVEPAPETSSLVAAIRARIDPAANATDTLTGSTRLASVRTSSDRAGKVAKPIPTGTERMQLTVALAIVILPFAAYLWVLSSLRAAADQNETDAGRPSLAVLPLANYSGDTQQDYVAAGITDELIGELGRIRGLRVISRTSVVQFRDTELSIPAIADSLGVGHVIEGSVAREGERIRLRVQLIRARPETHLWTETYERDVGEVLLLQREVAQAVARELGIADPMWPNDTPSVAAQATPEVFDVYLKGLYRTSRLEFDEAGRQFELALRMDPTFAPAYAALASVYLGEHAFGSLPGLEAYSKGKSAAERALALDPSSVEAHVALGRVYALNWQWSEAERMLRRAVEINPSYTEARVQYAGYLCVMGRHDEAIQHAREALRMDPLSPEPNRHLGETLLCAGRFENAIEHLELMVEFGMPSYEDLAYAYLAVGRNEEGLAAMRAAEDQFFPDPDRSERLAIAYAMASHDAEARRILGNIAQDSARVNPVAFAVVWAHLGDLDRAVEYLEQAYRVHDPWLWQIGHPLFAPLRRHPRYENLIERMRLPKPAI